MQPDIRLRREGDRNLPVLVWRWPQPMRSVASTPHGGGIGPRRWVVNAQVPPAYARRDPDHHLAKLGVSLGLPGRGVGMLTAADVRAHRTGVDDGVEVVATVGLGQPIMAAAPEPQRAPVFAGTINVVAVLPQRLSDAALVNAVATATEAKVQALLDAGVVATGTATDAVCILCPEEGAPADFGGPRSRWGSRLARAVHAAVLSGAGRA
ncbi:MAG TPA: adenosylcobinamide amidohydrolase [Acidimicrobiales bacterium]|nr:adenosylcobinamide amidohydrolase [Acidimicrobiales bacterium]